jgi:hypothetical protein
VKEALTRPRSPPEPTLKTSEFTTWKDRRARTGGRGPLVPGLTVLPAEMLCQPVRVGSLMYQTVLSFGR